MTIKKLVSYADENIQISFAKGKAFLLKIVHGQKNTEYLDFQVALNQYLQNHDIPIPKIQKTTDGYGYFPHGEGSYGRLYSWLEGDFLTPEDYRDPKRLIQVGRLFGQLTHILSNFKHAHMMQTNSWDLAHALTLESDIHRIRDEEARRHVQHFMESFRSWGFTALGHCRKSVIHNDGNEGNILKLKNDELGLIDFGDATYSYTICELAILSTYMAFPQNDPLEGLEILVRSFHREFPLTSQEIRLLHLLIGLRCCVSLVHSSLSYEQDPSQEYQLISQGDAKKLLRYLTKISPEKFSHSLLSACGFDNPEEKNYDQVFTKREQHIFPALRLSPTKPPLYITGGLYQYLFTHDHKTYVDTLNNVAHVGHGHPTVTKRIREALVKINTNTRYGHHLLGEYAEKLLDTFPDPLNKLVMVCSGSEASDLATRICLSLRPEAHTFLVMEGAYHGNSLATMHLSPYKKNHGAKPFDTLVLPIPHYEPGTPGEEDYFQTVDSHLAQLEGKLAGFICETILSCGGQKTLPLGFLKRMANLVRSYGGYYIADEVQVGFGRVGTGMWAFGSHEVIPDFVSLGKAMGNGHPVGGLVMGDSIAKEFASLGTEYFNSFGGNPVSCAAALGVLEVIEGESLISHAKDLGAFWKSELQKLAQENSMISEIRGEGLFLGIAFDPDRFSDCRSRVKEICDGLLQFGFLSSQDGIYGEVIKLKPPLVIQAHNVRDYCKSLRAQS